jgi:hypothetical protein
VGWIFSAIGAAAAGTAAMSEDHVWIVSAAILAGLTFVASVCATLWPLVRRYRLRHPCHVYFNIMRPNEGEVPYVQRAGKSHHLKELTLPPNSEFEIELNYLPKLDFYECEIMFGCEVEDPDGKPYAFECFHRFNLPGKGKDRWVPGVDEGHNLTRHKFYHMIRNRPRNVGTHRIVGFKFRTEKVGVWPMKVYFIMPELEGSADLTVRVEERPTTSMKCYVKEHGECYVYPTCRLPPEAFRRG